MTQPTTISAQTIAALAHILGAIRPDWQLAGIHAALNPHAGRDLATLTACALDAARTPTTTTPAGIHARLRDGWMANTTNQTQGPRTYDRCNRCGYEITEGHREHAQHCGAHRPRHELIISASQPVSR